MRASQPSLQADLLHRCFARKTNQQTRINTLRSYPVFPATNGVELILHSPSTVCGRVMIFTQILKRDGKYSLIYSLYPLRLARYSVIEDLDMTLSKIKHVTIFLHDFLEILKRSLQKIKKKSFHDSNAFCCM